MEILSTGQKIKRARIYKGITLKELCKDKISISKMSCIENGKVKADNDTIRYISDIIQVDYNYLIQDIYDQIFNNLQSIKVGNAVGKQLEDNININLGYAIEYEYYDLALELTHILFKYYMDIKDEKKCENLIPKYYRVYQKYNCNKATITYYLDIAKYLTDKKEYYEAIVYYSRLRELNIIDKDNEKKLLCEVKLKEAVCYINLGQYQEAFELLDSIINCDIVDEYKFSDVYHYYSIVLILLEKGDARKYINKYYKLVSDDITKLAYAKERISKAFFESGNKEEALIEVHEAIKSFPEDDKELSVDFINTCIEDLLIFSEYEEALELVEKNLNNAISVNNIKLIEKAYYLKGMILNRLGKIEDAEMYLNLSLDSLYKFGTKKERCERYIDMAYLYYKLGNYKDSVKYFNLSVEIEKAM